MPLPRSRRPDRRRARPDRREELAAAQRFAGLFHAIGHLAEPHDVRPQPSPGAAGEALGVLGDVVEPDAAGAAILAKCAAELAMHMDQLSLAGTLMQIIDVLGDDEDLASKRLREPGQGFMRGVGFDVAQLPPRIL